jgi:hypothetical protein
MKVDLINTITNVGTIRSARVTKEDFPTAGAVAASDHRLLLEKQAKLQHSIGLGLRDHILTLGGDDSSKVPRSSDALR